MRETFDDQMAWLGKLEADLRSGIRPMLTGAEGLAVVSLLVKTLRELEVVRVATLRLGHVVDQAEARREARMRMRDPRRDPLPGDVVLAMPDGMRADVRDQYLAEMRCVQLYTATPRRVICGYGRGGILCRVVELVRPPMEPVASKPQRVRDACTAVTWRPVETFDGLTPSLPRNSRTPYSAWLPSWRRWARKGEVLRVAEELPVQELAREQRAVAMRRRVEVSR